MTRSTETRDTLRIMLECHGCHRHVRLDETTCPFCGAPVQMAAAPISGKLGAMALVMGLSLLGCADDGEGESGMTTMDTTDSNSMGTGTSMTTDNTDPSSSEYGGPTGEEEWGDGDPGDGDGDPGDGDGDPGDGDGDGDPTGTGDTTGDGDGDTGGADYGGAPPPSEYPEY